MPDTPDTGPLEKVKRDMAVMGNNVAAMGSDIGEIKTDVYTIRQLLLGNGRGGLVERMALVEERLGVGVGTGKYILNALIYAAIGIASAVVTAKLMGGLP